MAAAWAHLISYAVILGVNVVMGQKHYPVPYQWWKIGSYIGAGLAIWAISLILPAMPLGVKLSIHTLLILGYLLFFWYRERTNIKQIT
jgi:hypothetical protein